MPFLISIDHPSTINGFDFNIFQPSPGIAGADHTVGHGFTTALTARSDSRRSNDRRTLWRARNLDDRSMGPLEVC